MTNDSRRATQLVKMKAPFKQQGLVQLMTEVTCKILHENQGPFMGPSTLHVVGIRDRVYKIKLPTCHPDPGVLLSEVAP